MILIDSNILIYALNVSSPKYKKARSFLKKNSPGIALSHQNIFETLRVLTHPTFPHRVDNQEAMKGLKKILETATLVTPSDLTPDITFELIEKYNLSSNRIFDAYLVATCLSNEIDIIATDNIKDFKIFPQIRVINPFS